MSERKLRVALVSIHYPPLCTSAAVQMSDLAQEFVRQGHETLVITPLEGLTSYWSIEFIGGVQVLHLASLKISLNNKLQRTIYEFSLPFLMILGLRKSPHRNKKWDLVVWYSPTIFFGLLIFYIKCKSACKAYLILRDIFPEWAYDLGVIRKGFAYHFFKIVANFQYAIADAIGVQTISNLDYFVEWKKKYGKRLEVLQNWQTPIKKVNSSIQIMETALAGRKIFVYIGNMGVAQGMDIMLDLAFQFIHRDDVGFLFVGRGSEVVRLRIKVAELSFPNILFFDEIKSDEMPGLLAQCHVGLIALDPRHKSHNIPGKFLTYLNAGIPVLARVNPNTDLVNLIEGQGVGLVYVGESIKVFKKMAEEIIDDSVQYQRMASKGPMLAKEIFSTSNAVRQIIQVVE
jgi:glycosyltransferase involved in cell wall biosynthesis